MKTTNNILKASKILSMSKKTKDRIDAVANAIKGKELFPEKVEKAKKVLGNLRRLPI